MRTFITCILAMCAIHCTRVDAVSVRLPNGAEGGVVHCMDTQDCYLQTQRVCPASYIVLKANDESANDFTSSRGLTEYIVQCTPLTPKTE